MRPLIVVLVAEPEIFVSVTVDPLVGTAIAVYEAMETPVPFVGGVKENEMLVIVAEVPVRAVGFPSVVCRVNGLDANEDPKALNACIVIV